MQGDRESSVRDFLAAIETLAPYLDLEEMGDALAFISAQAGRHGDRVEQRRRRREMEMDWETLQLEQSGAELEAARARRGQ